MNINKIGGISGKYSSSNFAKVNKEKSAFNDSISISEDAKSKISLKNSLELVKKTPDIRQDKVDTAKVNLGGYFSEGNINSDVTEKIAQKIVEDIWEGLV